MNIGNIESSRILIVDDEPSILEAESRLLRLEGFSNLVTVESAGEARRTFTQGAVALVLLDLTLKGETGQSLLEWLRREHPDTEVIVVTASSDVSAAVECMRSGARDYLVKGIDSERLVPATRNALVHRASRLENQRLRRVLFRDSPESPEHFSEFISQSAVVRRIFVYLEAIAETGDPVLVTGETGVGKEIVAKAIHKASGRGGKFVVVNIGGLDDHTFSDTLFGHRRGAFTGAGEIRGGLVREAAGGTLFLDEFGEISPESQVKLLRLIDTGDFRPLGSDRQEVSSARLVLATNRDLNAEVAAGRFRQDLLYRINQHWVEIPPLRERPEDLEPLALLFLDTEAQRLGVEPLRLGSAVLEWLRAHPLQGNVRELRQLITKSLVHGAWEIPAPTPSVSSRDGTVIFGDTLPSPEELIEALLREADRRNPANRAAAAESIGLSPQAFANRWRRMEGRSEDI